MKITKARPVVVKFFTIFAPKYQLTSLHIFFKITHEKKVIFNINPTVSSHGLLGPGSEHRRSSSGV